MKPEEFAMWIGIILTVMNVIDRVFVYAAKAKAPAEKFEKRLNELDQEIKNIKAKAFDDGDRIGNLEKSTKVLIKGVGALLSHGIDGNNTEEMKEARSNLNDYLVEK